MKSGTAKNLSHAFYIPKNPWRILEKLDLVNTIEDGIDSIYRNETTEKIEH